MAPFSDKVPADVAEKVNAVVDQIKSGDVVITPTTARTKASICPITPRSASKCGPGRFYMFPKQKAIRKADHDRG